jgi:hypothetical protein
MSNLYILKGKEIIPVDNMLEWTKIFKNNNRVVKYTRYGNILISTVFLGIDHGYESKVPIVFETMVFGGKHDEYQRRYSTYDEALDGHKEACKLAYYSIPWYKRLLYIFKPC